MTPALLYSTQTHSNAFAKMSSDWPGKESQHLVRANCRTSAQDLLHRVFDDDLLRIGAVCIRDEEVEQKEIPFTAGMSALAWKDNSFSMLPSVYREG